MILSISLLLVLGSNLLLMSAATNATIKARATPTAEVMSIASSSYPGDAGILNTKLIEMMNIAIADMIEISRILQVRIYKLLYHVVSQV